MLKKKKKLIEKSKLKKIKKSEISTSEMI